MLCPTCSYFLRGALLTTVLLFPVSQGKAADPDPGEESKPALLDVLLPADAQLEVDGHKTRSTGEVRHFETAPGQPACTVGIAIRAEANAPAGKREVRVHTAAGASKAEGALKVTVVPAPPRTSP